MKQIAWIALGWLVLLGPAYGEEIQKDKLSSSILVQRGKQFHTVVIQIWEKLKKSKSLQMTNDISEAVAKYIPVGTSFDDAEVILRSAGFGIWQQTNSKICDLGADLVIESTVVYMTQVSILIWSKKQNGNQNIVGRVTASLSNTSL